MIVLSRGYEYLHNANIHALHCLHSALSCWVDRQNKSTQIYGQTHGFLFLRDTSCNKSYLGKKTIQISRQTGTVFQALRYRETQRPKFLPYELSWQEFKFLTVFFRYRYYLKPIKMFHLSNLSPSAQVVLKHAYAITASHFHILKVS